MLVCRPCECVPTALLDPLQLSSAGIENDSKAVQREMMAFLARIWPTMPRARLTEVRRVLHSAFRVRTEAQFTAWLPEAPVLVSLVDRQLAKAALAPVTQAEREQYDAFVRVSERARVGCVGGGCDGVG